MKNTDKVTLTVEQLKKLVKESKKQKIKENYENNPDDWDYSFDYDTYDPKMYKLIDPADLDSVDEQLYHISLPEIVSEWIIKLLPNNLSRDVKKAIAEEMSIQYFKTYKTGDLINNIKRGLEDYLIGLARIKN